MVQQLSEPFDPLMSHPAALEKRRYALSPMQAIAVCTRRQVKLVLRDKVLLKGRMLQVRRQYQGLPCAYAWTFCQRRLVPAAHIALHLQTASCQQWGVHWVRCLLCSELNPCPVPCRSSPSA
jgi:hypothetical protein